MWIISGQWLCIQTPATLLCMMHSYLLHIMVCVYVIVQLILLTYSNGVRPMFDNFFGAQVHGLALLCSCNEMLPLPVHTIHTVLDSPPFWGGQHGHFTKVYRWIWFFVHLCWVNCWKRRRTYKLQRGLWFFLKMAVCVPVWNTIQNTCILQ